MNLHWLLCPCLQFAKVYRFGLYRDSLICIRHMNCNLAIYLYVGFWGPPWYLSCIEMMNSIIHFWLDLWIGLSKLDYRRQWLDSFVLIGRHGSFVDVLLWWVVWVIHFHHAVGLISLDYGFDSSNEFVLDSQVMIKVRDMYWENANSCGFWVCVWYLTCTGTWLPFMNGKFRFWDGYAEFMPEVSCFIPMVGM
jgi:hypothetical protein